jgi:hypothetical protein
MTKVMRWLTAGRPKLYATLFKFQFVDYEHETEHCDEDIRADRGRLQEQ